MSIFVPMAWLTHQLAKLGAKLPGEGEQFGHLERQTDEDEEQVSRGQGRQEHIGRALTNLELKVKKEALD